MDLKLRSLEGLNHAVMPQPATGSRRAGEPETTLPEDRAEVSRSRPRAKKEPTSTSPSPPATEPAPVAAPTAQPVPTTLVQLDEGAAPAVEATAPRPAASAPTPPPPASPSSRVAELPKTPALLNVLSRALHASRRIAFGLLSVLGTDPLKKVKSEQEQVNACEPALNAEIEAKKAELAKAGASGDLALEATRQVVQAKTVEFRQRIADGASLESLKVEAFAVARKSAEVVLKMCPYDVQVMGGLAMTEGRISEMKTGEGKTLTAVMPLYLYGLTGKGAHLVTENDYLVKRDFEQMKPVFEFMGLTVGCVHEGAQAPEKKAAYACDVTYVTNHSLGFDFLRDSMAREPSERVQRPPHFALVDEVDEILIDEARTPLILSTLSGSAGDEHRTFDVVVKALEPGRDYKSNHKEHYAYLTEEGQAMVERLLGAMEAGQRESEASLKLQSLSQGASLEEVQAASRAYDEARKASQTANKVVAAHLNLRRASTDEERALAEEEIQAAGTMPSYNLYSTANIGRVFFLQNALEANTLFEKDKDYLAADDKVEIVDMFKGRAMEGRRFTNGLHQALEAKEGVTIQPYQRTLAQITYPDLFRRYPHLAGMSGTAMSAAGEFHEAYNLDVVAIPTNKPKALETENDIVFRTFQEKFEFVADRVAELYKEGKPVLVGTRSIPANKYLSWLLAQRGIHHQVLNAQSVRDNNREEAEILADAGRSGMVTLATNMAGRGVDIKPDLMNYKKMAVAADVAAKSGQAVVVDVDKPRDAEQIGAWLQTVQIASSVLPEGQPTPEVQAGQVLIRIKPDPGPDFPGDVAHIDGRSEAYQTGGLHLIMTERHQAERIDLQLEGRPARQGQPGSRLAVLSCEDELLRYFGSEKLANFFDSMGVPPGQGVSDPRLDEMVKSAQSAVEARHYEVRKDTTKYGQVGNKQRESFTGFRDQVVDGTADVDAMAREWIPRAVARDAFELEGERQRANRPEFEWGGVPSHLDAEQLARSLQELSQKYGLELKAEMPAGLVGKKRKISPEELEDQLRPQLMKHYEETAAAFPAKALERFQRQAILDVADEAWMNQLENLDALRTGIGMEALAQKDPWIEYQLRAYDLFESMMHSIQSEAGSSILRQMTTEAQLLKEVSTPKTASE